MHVCRVVPKDEPSPKVRFMIVSWMAFPRIALELARGHLDPEILLERWRTPPAGIQRAKRFLFLAFGPNPSFDYYLRHRIARSGLAEIEVIDTDATAPDPARWEGAHIVVCRYLASHWRRALGRSASKLAGLTIFIDDDYFALVQDAKLPARYRWRVLRDGVSLLAVLPRLRGRLLVSTPALATRYAPLSPIVLPPMPAMEAASPPVSHPHPVIAFHATASHDAEHAFVAEVARRVLAMGHRATFDIVASAHTAKAWQGLPDVVIRAPMTWDRFRQLPDILRADLQLAPLEDTPLNRMRAATKAIDAVRLGAAGIFADLAPYHPIREAGPLLPRDIDAWAGEIGALLQSQPHLAERKQRLRRIVETWAAGDIWPCGWNPAAMLLQ